MSVKAKIVTIDISLSDAPANEGVNVHVKTRGFSSYGENEVRIPRKVMDDFIQAYNMKPTRTVNTYTLSPLQEVEFYAVLQAAARQENIRAAEQRLAEMRAEDLRLSAQEAQEIANNRAESVQQAEDK